MGLENCPKNYIKYLGVWMDKNMTFNEHITRMANRAGETVAALGRLMPNVGGPKASKRRTMSSVAHSIMLFAAPVWEGALKIVKIREKFARVQRQMALRISSAYRTASREAVLVIAEIPPTELLARERVEVYEEIPKGEARNRLMQDWQRQWTHNVEPSGQSVRSQT
ncbi:hypothetical protein NQ314_014407 [Rhamnusium bicolor]|uniref:Reverse transcriptase n=1 Tax=Rhamnusium bicolor TaxID=1586634 RepID=A0AAV8X2G1_9CUCU|nr:hypothetical protein NQ314_014407 [Rhamnusium bicolor]